MVKPQIIVLDNIRSAYNVGTIIRTVDALGPYYKIIIVGMTAKLDNIKVIKTSLGAEKIILWEYIPTMESTIKMLKENDYNVYTVEIGYKSIEYTKVKYVSPSAFIFGHEIRGVSDVSILKADQVVHIPMLGGKESLNIAISVGIVMFEVKRQMQIK